MTLLLSHSFLMLQLLSAAEDVPTKFFEAITKADLPAVRAFLKEKPELARAKNARGSSALLVAATLIDTRGCSDWAFSGICEAYFVPPAENQVLHEIMRLAPPADVDEACLVGDLKRARTFLEKNPDAVRQTDKPWTLLHSAAYSGNVELVKLLLSRGAPIDAVANTKYKNTPLQTAMLTRQAAVARVLVEACANVNHAQWEGGTALHDAARQGNVELVRFFVSHGANVNARSTHGARGVTPAEDARDYGHTKLAAVLEKLGSAATAKSQSNSTSVAAPAITTDWAGEDLWYKCRGCHGLDGKSKTKVGVEHNIPDLTSPTWQSKTSDEEIRRVITNGSDKDPKMKAFGEMYSQKEIENLITHIRSMKAK